MKKQTSHKRYLRLQKYVKFTEAPIGNKEEVNTILSKSSFASFLPTSLSPKTLNEVVDFTSEHKKVVLKPVWGCQGVGILIIEKKNEAYIIHKDEASFPSTSLLVYLADVNIDEYILQQFVVSETTNGLPVDFRIHTQKDSEGKFVLTKVYPRIASVKNKVTNYSQGGTTVDIQSYLEPKYKEDWKVVLQSMKVFALQLSEFLDEKYHQSLNELGIDIGLTEDRKIYLYEVNWRPGVPIIFNGELNHAKSLLSYCKYRSKSLS